MIKNKKPTVIKTKKNYFPNNLRFITDNSIYKFLAGQNKILLVFFTSALIILGILAVSANLYAGYLVNSKLTLERRNIEKDIKFWESVTQKYPYYRDAYFELALLNYRMKDYNASRYYLNKTLKIDPNFEKGMEFEENF